LSIGNRNRREFLLGAGVVLANAVASPPLIADASRINPDLITAVGDPTSARKSAAGTDESDSRTAAVQGKMRGLMVDAGRVPETIAYYRRVIEFCADWELNTLQFRLADDQGSAMRFTSVPDLVTHGNAFTPEQLKSLAEYGQSHGVDLIPELESFGHTGYITRSPVYAHLLDREASGSSEFTGIIPVSSESLQLFEKLYREVAATFSSIYLHGGCDEVNWGGSMLSRRALQTKTRAQIWAEYLNSLNKIAVGLGKQFIIWGDIVLHKEPEILGQLNKNIIIMDWNYSGNNSARFRETFQKVSANGSRGIGAPALSCYKWGARVGTEQLRNIDAYADAYLEAKDPNSLGVILTNWVPSRYVQNSIWDGFAYAAVAFNEGTGTAQTSGFRHFVEKHYRANWNEVWGEVFHMIYDAAPYMKDRETASWMGLLLPVPWSNDEELTALLKHAFPQPNPFTRIRSLLVQLEPLVVKHFSDFQAFELCIKYLERMFWREGAVIEQAARKPLEREATDLLIQSIAERDRDLAEALSRDWDAGRFPNSAAKLEPVFDLQPKDQLLFQWERATAYSASLASHPDRFYQLVRMAKLV
jgi:Glycosyl hydrolase family 20, catalytic domain